MTPSTSWPASTAATARARPGRRGSQPKTSRADVLDVAGVPAGRLAPRVLDPDLGAAHRSIAASADWAVPEGADRADPGIPGTRRADALRPGVSCRNSGSSRRAAFRERVRAAAIAPAAGRSAPYRSSMSRTVPHHPFTIDAWRRRTELPITVRGRRLPRRLRVEGARGPARGDGGCARRP